MACAKAVLISTLPMSTGAVYRRGLPARSTGAVYRRGLDEVVSMRRDVLDSSGDFDPDGTAEDYFHLGDMQNNSLVLVDSEGQMVESYAYGTELRPYAHFNGNSTAHQYPNDFGMPVILDEDGAVLHANFTQTGLPTHYQSTDGATAGTPYGSRFGNPWLFNGRAWDAELGLYHYRNRYLDPVQGRFTTRDPIGLWGDPMNLGNGYSYVGNNPWTYVDPFGLDTSTMWNDPLSAVEHLDQTGVNSGQILINGGLQNLNGQMQEASGTATSLVGGALGIGSQGIVDPTSEWQQMAVVVGAEGRNEAIGAVTGAGATAVGLSAYQRYLARPVGNAISGAWGRVCALFGRGADDAAEEALRRGQQELLNTLPAILRQQAGFADEGIPIILDENFQRAGLVEELRSRGYNILSKSEIFGEGPFNVGGVEFAGLPDPIINQFANQIGARVLTRDKGSQIAEGFFQNAIRVPDRVSDVNNIVWYMQQALDN